MITSIYFVAAFPKSIEIKYPFGSTLILLDINFADCFIIVWGYSAGASQKGAAALVKFIGAFGGLSPPLSLKCLEIVLSVCYIAHDFQAHFNILFQ